MSSDLEVIPTLNLGESAPVRETFDHIPWDAPERRKTATGVIAYATDQGNKSNQEDRVVIDTLARGDDGKVALRAVVVDGISGSPQAFKEPALKVITDRFSEGFRAGQPVSDIHRSISRELEAYPLAGATYAAVELEANALKVDAAGDVLVYRIFTDADGSKNITRVLDPHRSPSGKVVNYLMGKGNSDLTAPEHHEVYLEPGDRVIVASDYLMDNVETIEEILKTVDGKSPEAAIKALNTKISKNEQKRDNRSILIYDHGADLHTSYSRNENPLTDDSELVDTEHL